MLCVHKHIYNSQYAGSGFLRFSSSQPKERCIVDEVTIVEVTCSNMWFIRSRSFPQAIMYVFNKLCFTLHLWMGSYKFTAGFKPCTIFLIVIHSFSLNQSELKIVISLLYVSPMNKDVSNRVFFIILQMLDVFRFELWALTRWTISPFYSLLPGLYLPTVSPFYVTGSKE